MFKTTLSSPIGELTLASRDGRSLAGLWLAGQKYFPETFGWEPRGDLPAFRQASEWLDAYWAQSPLPAIPPLTPEGTPFRQAVWALLREIPWGHTVTYGQLACRLRERGISTAARAVGGAVGHNPISILIPCHRVVGADGSLTGYAGGTDRKRFLLELEGVDTARLIVPDRGTALEEESSRSPLREKKLILPRRVSGHRSMEPQPPERPGVYPCPCCGCRTYPVPPAEALAYICPVCLWENDLFTASEDEPSDENHGLTLNQGRENYRRCGVCDPRLTQYARPPRPEEMHSL